MSAGGLRHGFKAHAERLAVEVRRELGLSPVDRFNPTELARHLAVPVLSLLDLQKDAQSAVHHFACDEPETFSAVTVFHGTARLIVVNHVHSPGRQANSLAHELSHLLLEHEPSEVVDALGCRRWDHTMENEANWLAGALLIPRDAALSVLRDAKPVPEDAAADYFGVSDQLLQWRLNNTGARRQVEREHRRHPYPHR